MFLINLLGSGILNAHTLTLQLILQGTLDLLTVNLKMAAVIYYFCWEVESNSSPFNFRLAIVETSTSTKVRSENTLQLRSGPLGTLFSSELLCEMPSYTEPAMLKSLHVGTPVNSPSWAQLSNHPCQGANHKR